MAGLVKGLPAVLLFAGPMVTSAQLADPTRPPVTADALIAPAASVPAVGSLQSVILRKNGKPAALIDGTIVELGDRVGESRLIGVSEHAVVLEGPAGEETLRLMPAAEKKPGKGRRQGDK